MLVLFASGGRNLIISTREHLKELKNSIFSNLGQVVKKEILVIARVFRFFRLFQTIECGAPRRKNMLRKCYWNIEKAQIG